MLSPSFVDDALTLVRMHDETIAATPKAVKRALARMGGDVELFRTLVGIKRADALAQSSLSAPRVQLADDLERVLEEVIESNDAFTLRQLALRGGDVMQLGIPAGPDVGRALQSALDAVIDGRVPNEHDALIGYIAGEMRASSDAL